MYGKAAAICGFLLAFCVLGTFSESTRMFPRDAVTGDPVISAVYMTDLDTGDQYHFTGPVGNRMQTTQLPTGLKRYSITVLPADTLHYNLTVDLGLLSFDFDSQDVRWLGNFYVSTFLPEGNYRVVVAWDDQTSPPPQVSDVDLKLLTPFNCTVSASNPSCPGSELVASSTVAPKRQVIDIQVNSTAYYGEYQLNAVAPNISAAIERYAHIVLWGPAGVVSTYALNTANQTVLPTDALAYWKVANLVECSWAQDMTELNEITDEETTYPWPYSICDKEPFEVVISVRNSNDDPLVDANVTIIDLQNIFETQILFTNATGSVSTIIRNGNYKFEILQAGYVPLSEERTVGAAGAISFVLTPEDVSTSTSTSTGDSSTSDDSSTGDATSGDTVSGDSTSGDSASGDSTSGGGDSSSSETSSSTSDASSSSTAATSVTTTTGSRTSSTGDSSIIVVSYTIMISMIAFLLL